VPAPQRTTRIEDDIWNPAQARAKPEGATLGALMRAAVQAYAAGHLTSTAQPASQATVTLTSQPGPASQRTAALTLPAGEPCPGTVCSGPGCWNRNTTRYGHRHLVLCTACAAALRGQEYKRETSPATVRLTCSGAA